MITMGIFEAKTQLSELAQSAASGEVVVLTKRGKPIAQIRALQDQNEWQDTQNVIDALRAFRRKINVGSFDIAKLVAQGRK
jgi:prevent-host-death family protein